MANKAGSAARNEHVDNAVKLHEGIGRRAIGGIDEGNAIGGKARGNDRFAQRGNDCRVGMKGLRAPRNTHALPDFRQMPAASAVTFGRASYTMATTPSGTLTRVSSMPPSISRRSSTRPNGSGRPASDSRASAMALMRSSSKESLSSKPDDMPAALPASISTLLPARMSAILPRSEADMAKSAWLRTFSEARPTACEAACARSAISRTDSSIEVIIVSNRTI